MRGKITVLVLLSLIGLAGLVGAEHLSIGASDTTGGARETSADPSVDAALHARGTTPGCEDAHVRPEEASMAFADRICGELVYHEGTEHAVTAPRDQQLLGLVDGFDAYRTHNLGPPGLRTCQPWCLQPGVTDAAYDLVNNVAWRADLSHSDWADEADRGYQRYGGGLQVPHAFQVANQDAAIGEGDGWVLPSPDETFVAFLEDEEGVPIGEDRLERLVQHSDALPPGAKPMVCGFSPDLDVAHEGCELAFAWHGDGGDRGDNPCQSPAYVCGASQEAWHARLVCPPGARCGNDAERRPGEPPRQAPRNPFEPSAGPGQQLGDPIVWHFVVAPTESGCDGHREPGFALAPVADRPFLAHDLDVYTSPDSAFDPQASSLAAPAIAWTGSTLADAVTRTTDPAWGTPAAEPNHEDEHQGVQDTSRSREIERTWTACQPLIPPAEGWSSFDPWVDILDARLEHTDTGAAYEGTIEPPTGLDGEQARIGTYTPTGRAVYAVDRDDDGDHERAPWRGQFVDVADSGVYPVLWDMHVDGDGRPATDAGCPVHGGATSVQLALPEAMLAAGYAARTGIVQAFALDEPVVWTHRPTNQRASFPNGGVFLLASQSVHQLGLPGPTADPTVQAHVSRTAQAAADAAGLANPSPVVLREELEIQHPAGQGSDLQAQCGEEAGGFTSGWSLTRTCPAHGACTSSAAITRVLVDTHEPDPAFHEHAAWARPFPDGHEEAFPEGLQAWTDVDRLAPVSE